MSSTSNIDTTQSHSTPSSPSFRHVDDEIQIGSVVVTSTPQLTKLNHQVVSSSATPQVTSSGSPSTTSHSESTLTPPPRSPGSGSVLPANITAGDLQTTEKTGETSRVSLSRKESYKAQRQHYREEKARVTSALLHSIDDPSVVVLSDWLKVRGTLKSWTKLWCVLKPGVLLLYKSSKAKSSHWVGTVLLTSCRVIERPSKKDGFCFKLYHPLEQSIWAPRGPHNETLGAVIQPLPTAHLIFRAPSQSAGHRWLDSLELALQCNDAMLRCSLNESRPIASFNPESYQNSAQTISHDDLEKHFNEHELDSVDVTESDSEMSANGQPATTPRVPVDEPDTLSVPERVTGTGASVKLVDAETQALKIIKSIEEFYTEEEAEEIVASGEIVEEIAEENKSLLWFLIKQVRPGMDLSKVVLPTFILEPRSFLDKLADNYYHADILAEACTIDDPYTRFKKVLKWYLSGLYKKPKGLKKPYNPVLGEVFRCYWDHTKTGSKTYYVAEQVSHHPPVSAFYVSNRKEGFVIEGSLLAKSKFYGNSTAAILDGVARVVLTSRNNETYITSAPYAQCKGIVIGTLSMELGGKVTVNCVTTGYKADIDFKIRSFLGSSDQTNGIYGHITYGKKTVATLDGYWDGRIDLREKKGGEESVLMDVETLKRVRLKRHLVKLENQEEFESQRLWNNVSIAIHNDDQVAATDAKTIIEEAQRERARNAANLGHRLFDHSAEPIVDDLDGSLIDLGWRYKHANFGAWDMETEVLEYEKDFVIRSLYKQGQAEETRSSSVYSRGPRSLKIRSDTDSTEEIHHRRKYSRSMKATLHAIDDAIREQTMAIEKLSTKVNEITATQKVTPSFRPQNLGRVQQTSHSWDLFAGFILAIILQALLNWLFLH